MGYLEEMKEAFKIYMEQDKQEKQELKNLKEKVDPILESFPGLDDPVQWRQRK